MRIVVPIKSVPDLVEDIELNADQTSIDLEYLTFVLNEWDAQALEEALLIKDANDAQVVVLGLADDPEIDLLLYTALAKGADAAVKVTAEGAQAPPEGVLPSVAARAAIVAGYLAAEPADLVLTGVQAVDDLDGQLPGVLGAHLEVPHVSVVVGIEATGDSLVVRQEFAGGRSNELEVQLPAVIGVQSAQQPPRYAPISRIRQAQQAGGLREVTLQPLGSPLPPVVRRMHSPEATGRAEMLEGSAAEVAERIVGLLADRGLVKG